MFFCLLQTQDEWFMGVTKPPLMVSLKPSATTSSSDTTQQQEESIDQPKPQKQKERVTVADRFAEYVGTNH
jgi:hypothetical protein